MVKSQSQENFMETVSTSAHKQSSLHCALLLLYDQLNTFLIGTYSYYTVYTRIQ